ncbi:MAG: SPOR domain-containing protein, partial [Cryomorphaceae bacterium]
TEATAKANESKGLAAVKGNWLGMVEIIAEKEDFSDVEESMFVEAETSIYDTSKPIPVDPVMPDGLIFQVQVGAYRNPIPQDLFGPYAPIMGQKLDNGITRYRAGLFKKYEEAIQARNEIRTKGYSDAFVVVYVNGEKLTGEQARDILAQAKEKEGVSIELISGIPTDEPLAESSEVTKEITAAAPNTEYYNDPEAAEAAQVEVITGLFYTVQVGVYSKPVKLDQLYNLTELNSELTSSGVIRYTTGRFGDLAKARGRKDLAVNKGVADAFITAYYNGKRISLTEAEEILNTEGTGALATQVVDSSENTPSSEEATDESYVVIMGTFTDDVPRELADLFLENKSWGIRKIQGPGNGAIYLSEDMPSLAEAKKLLEECKVLNIKSAAIGIMKDGKITSVQND